MGTLQYHADWVEVVVHYAPVQHWRATSVWLPLGVNPTWDHVKWPISTIYGDAPQNFCFFNGDSGFLPHGGLIFTQAEMEQQARDQFAEPVHVGIWPAKLWASC
jgi:hypothetical protein